MTGSITGTVTGPTGDPERDVLVEVYEDGASNPAGTAKTDGSGEYSVTKLPDGVYDAKFDKGGYTFVEQTGVSVQGESTTVDVTLDWAYRKVIGDANPNRGVGLFGRSLSSSGPGYGVFGVSGGKQSGSAAIRAEATKNAYGLSVSSEKANAIHVRAVNSDAIDAKSENKVGVNGRTTGFLSDGVRGTHSTSDGAGSGVYGETRSENDLSAAVRGFVNRSLGEASGVYGGTDSSDGYGVYSEGQLRAERDVTGNTDTNLRRHVATVENTSGSQDGDVLGLKTQVSDPQSSVNFISFLDGSKQVGQIEGDGSGGIAIKGTTADFAEFFPKADPDCEFDDGDVVGLESGAVVADTDNADAVFVVSSRPLLVGNKPLDGEDGDCVALSLVGQVPVSVSEQVDAGDVLVPAAEQTGTAVPRRCRDGTGHPTIGIALASADAGEAVRTVIGGPSPVDSSEAESQQSEESERIESLEAENERLRGMVEELSDRLAAVEARVDDDPAGSPAPADD
jgi:hypothetical protein